MSKTIIIDPGHGGFDPGAVYENRKEKDDNLRLALAVGQELQDAGYDIIYTRTDDRYDSPYDKAQIANSAGGDLFLSFHRNFAETPDLYQGVQALVYDKDPLALRVAKNVNEQLEMIGFDNLGIESRKELVVLRRTAMPAVLLEVGFINSGKDNALFDDNFDAIANAIATGVEKAIPLSSVSSQKSTVTMADSSVPSSQDAVPVTPFTAASDSKLKTPQSPSDDTPTDPTSEMHRCLQDTPAEPTPTPAPLPPMWYYVQVGLFRYPENAVYLMEQLKQQGYDAVWKRVGGLIAIWVGPSDTLDETVLMQEKLQGDGYETLIVTDISSAR